MLHSTQITSSGLIRAEQKPRRQGILAVLLDLIIYLESLARVKYQFKVLQNRICAALADPLVIVSQPKQLQKIQTNNLLLQKWTVEFKSSWHVDGDMGVGWKGSSQCWVRVCFCWKYVVFELDVEQQTFPENTFYFSQSSVILTSFSWTKRYQNKKCISSIYFNEQTIDKIQPGAKEIFVESIFKLKLQRHLLHCKACSSDLCLSEFYIIKGRSDQCQPLTCKALKL